MADSKIGGLTQATQLNADDLMLLEQGGIAKKLKGETFNAYVYDTADNYISNIKEGPEGPSIARFVQKSGTHAPGTTDVYRAVLTNGYEVPTDIRVYNGADGEGAVSSVNGKTPVSGNITVTGDDINLSSSSATKLNTAISGKLDASGTRTFNGTLTVTGDLKVNGHNSAIGTVSNVTLPESARGALLVHSTWTAILEIYLPAGTWVLNGFAKFAQTSTNMLTLLCFSELTPSGDEVPSVDGNNRFNSTHSGVDDADRIGSWTRVQTGTINWTGVAANAATVSTGGYYYLYAHTKANSGSPTIAVSYAGINAVRIA